MIISASKGMYQRTLLGEKPLTTRLKLPAHIAVGKQWAIVPKRASPAWWFGSDGDYWQIITNPRLEVAAWLGANLATYSSYQACDYLRSQGYVQAAIVIVDYWQTPLQRMTEREAFEDGGGTLQAFAALWDSINAHKGIRWADNPTVWRIRYRLPQTVTDAVARVGRQAILDAHSWQPSAA